MWTGPSSPQKEEVDVFADHPVVRRVVDNGFYRRAVE